MPNCSRLFVVIKYSELAWRQFQRSDFYFDIVSFTFFENLIYIIIICSLIAQSVLDPSALYYIILYIGIEKYFRCTNQVYHTNIIYFAKIYTVGFVLTMFWYCLKYIKQLDKDRNTRWLVYLCGSGQTIDFFWEKLGEAFFDHHHSIVYF